MKDLQNGLTSMSISFTECQNLSIALRLEAIFNRCMCFSSDLMPLCLMYIVSEVVKYVKYMNE